MAEIKKHTRSFIISFCFVVACVWLAISLIQTYSEINDVKDEIASVQQSIDRQVAENAQLKGYLDSGKIDEYVEKIARDDLGYVKPGEHIYYDVSVTD